VAGAVKAAHDIAPPEPVAVHEFTGAAQPELHAPSLLFAGFAEARAARGVSAGGGARERKKQAHAHAKQQDCDTHEMRKSSSGMVPIIASARRNRGGPPLSPRTCGSMCI